MSSRDQTQQSRRLILPESGAYSLKPVLDNIPLTGDEGEKVVSITCVEHWDVNLYIGTSASEILHLVALPAETEDEPPIYILASRLQPSGHASTPPPNQAPGVQQILILPGPSKACVLCNGVVSFYTLPELSPASPSKEPTGVQWIGGIDENEGRDNPEGPVVMLANSRRIMMVRVGEKLRQIKTVDYPGCLQSSRRDTIACVANDNSYALLEVEHQQQIPLFPIYPQSTHSEASTVRNASSPLGHSRSTSLGNPLSSNEIHTVTNAQNLEIPDAERMTPSEAVNSSRPTTRPRSSTDALPQRLSSRITVQKLKPHILSPSPVEFMLTTGTTKSEPGVGMFVDLDGEVVRGTIEFDRYPDAVLIYNFNEDSSLSTDTNKQHVLALLDKTDLVHGRRGLEIQELVGSAEITTTKTWIPIESEMSIPPTGGVYQCLTAHRHNFSQVTELLQAVRIKPSTNRTTIESDPRTDVSIARVEQETALFENHISRATSPTREYEQKRNEEERKFVSRLGQASTRALIWYGSNLWQVLPNPLLFQLENTLLQSGVVVEAEYSFESVNISKIVSLLGSIRDQEPQSEAESFALTYIRKKASLLLLLHLQRMISSNLDLDSAGQLVRRALIESLIDPRVVLLLVPPIAHEVLQGPDGIWLHKGIVSMLDANEQTFHGFSSIPLSFWLMIRYFLSDWQEKRGYGSITDEKYVFDSVDAALLHVLLYLDEALPGGSNLQVATRKKLNSIVDHWKGDFHRAVFLLEHHERLFVLSRLYQSRRLAKDVLATWKRIAEGEHDRDTSLTVEMVQFQVREYLTKISNAALVQEYGLWLAQRDPSLAVQLFADDHTRVKFTPADVVTMLKDRAPGAVQQYLEHLVFGKHLDQYSDDLIGYYLDSVLSVLETDQAARESLKESYVAYRALESPKPTYLNFITQNAPPQPWWRSRLRLLQLLGSGGYATKASRSKELTYSVDLVLERLAPFSSSLVSESIILDARQGRHKEALRLLTHGLGDYDTAVRYCYFGGPAPSSSQPIDASLLPSRENQRGLFSYLFHEFLRIENIEERLERTSHLLGTFATWFDPLTVFEDIPQDWTIDMLSEFLLRSFRAATSIRNEAIIKKALSAAQNLQTQAAFIGVCEKLGPKIVDSELDPTLEGHTASVT